MADNNGVLSQEEIDRLLAGLASGDSSVQVEETTMEKKVQV